MFVMCGIFAINKWGKRFKGMYYIHKDYLGSFETVTDGSGQVREKLSFDPCSVKLGFRELCEPETLVELIPTALARREGRRRRNPTDWTYNNVPETFLFDRGFTGHEHLDNFDLINMNGRVYDPWLGRFLSPDPFVQAPTYSQNYNRYSYALNNPLKYTDPSGYYYGPAKDIINEGYYDLASQTSYAMDYLCGVNNWFYQSSFANSGFGMPGSGSHWSDQNRSEYGNYMITSSNGFDSNYGAGASNMVRAMSSNPAVFKEWKEGGFTLQDLRDGKAKHADISYGNGGFWVRSSKINNVFFDTGDGSKQLQEVEIINTWVATGTIGNGSSGVHDAIKYGLFGTSVWANTIYAGFEAALKTQPTVSTWLKGSRVFGRGSYYLSGANITYDFLSGTANTSTLVNAGVTAVGAGVVIFVGAAATPYVIGAGLVYGIISVAGGDEWLDSNFDISDQLNFIKP